MQTISPRYLDHRQLHCLARLFVYAKAKSMVLILRLPMTLA